MEDKKHSQVDYNIQVTQFHKFENLEDLCEGIEIIYFENGTALKDSPLFGEILENYSPTTRDPSEFIDYIFDELQKHEGFFKKLSTGELVPLTKEEIAAFKGQFTANLTTYFHQKYDIKIQLIQEKKDSDSNAKSSSLIDRGEKLAENRTTCTVRDIRSPEYREKIEKVIISCDVDFTTMLLQPNAI